MPEGDRQSRFRRALRASLERNKDAYIYLGESERRDRAMKHARADYNSIQTHVTNGTARQIPEDEPVFLLRAQDKHAAATVRHWAALVTEEQGEASEIARVANEHADRMDAWPVKKSPDLPNADEPTEDTEIEVWEVSPTLDSESDKVLIKDQVYALGYLRRVVESCMDVQCDDDPLVVTITRRMIKKSEYADLPKI